MIYDQKNYLGRNQVRTNSLGAGRKHPEARFLLSSSSRFNDSCHCTVSAGVRNGNRVGHNSADLQIDLFTSEALKLNNCIWHVALARFGRLNWLPRWSVVFKRVVFSSDGALTLAKRKWILRT